MCHEHGSARILHHEGEAFARIGGVERDVGTAGFQDAEEGNHHVERAFQAQADECFRFDPKVPQMGRELAGAPVQFAISQHRTRERHRHRVRRAHRLFFKQFVDALVAGEIGAGVVPLDQKAPALLRSQRGRQTRSAHVRTRKRRVSHSGSGADERLRTRKCKALPPPGCGPSAGQIFQDSPCCA